MGSCKLGWSGNSISFSVVSDVSYVRWLLVAALRAPRPSSRRALAAVHSLCSAFEDLGSGWVDVPSVVPVRSSAGHGGVSGYGTFVSV